MADVGGATSEVVGLIADYLEDKWVGPIIPQPVGNLVVLRNSPLEYTYKMRGRDTNCGTLTYRTWTSLDAADFTGANYDGAFCGGGLSLAEITVVRIEKG